MVAIHIYINIPTMRIEHLGHFGNLWHSIFCGYNIMDKVERRNENARRRYIEAKEKQHREFIEHILSIEPPQEIAQICYDLLGSGGYKTLDWRTRKMLSVKMKI